MEVVVKAQPTSMHGCTVRLPGFTLTSGMHGPRATLPRHHHELPTLCYVMRGGFTEYSRGHAMTCIPNTLKLTPAGDEHWNHFQSVQTHGLLVEIEPSRFEETRSIADLLGDRVHLRGGPAAEVARRLVLELAEGDDAALVAAEGLLLELLASLARTDASLSRGAHPKWLTGPVSGDSALGESSPQPPIIANSISPFSLRVLLWGAFLANVLANVTSHRGRLGSRRRILGALSGAECRENDDDQQAESIPRPWWTDGKC